MLSGLPCTTIDVPLCFSSAVYHCCLLEGRYIWLIADALQNLTHFLGIFSRAVGGVLWRGRGAFNQALFPDLAPPVPDAVDQNFPHRCSCFLFLADVLQR